MKTILTICLIMAAWPAIGSVYLPKASLTGIYTLDGSSADLPSSDLAPLKNIIGNAQVVGLGESVHGSGGFLKMKFRVIKYMVEKLGFRAIGLESNWLDAQAATDYVANCTGSPEDAISSLRSFFRGPTDEAMLKWLCTFNRNHPNDRVFFFGFDVQEPYHQIKALQSFLLANNPKVAKNLLAGLRSCLGVDTNSWSELMNSQEWKTYLAKGISPTDFTSCIDGIDSIRGYVKEHDYNHNSLSQLELTELVLSNLESWERMNYYVGKKSMVYGQQARDIGMLHTVEVLKGLYFPKQKVILSCHSVHVGAHIDKATGSILTRGGFANARHTMGVMLARKLGKDYVPIGFTGYDVHSQWPLAPTMPIPTDRNSIEVQLHDLQLPYILLDTRGSFVDPHRIYGMSLEGSEINLNLPANFRALIYLDKAPAE